MSKNVILNGQTYNGVSEVSLPISGGTAKFKDEDEIPAAPSGTKTITANGNGIDVTNYAAVDVNVSGGGGGVIAQTYTQAEDWITDSTGNAKTFHNAYVAPLLNSATKWAVHAEISGNEAMTSATYAISCTYGCDGNDVFVGGKWGFARSNNTRSNENGNALNAWTSISFYLKAGNTINVSIMIIE